MTLVFNNNIECEMSGGSTLLIKFKEIKITSINDNTLNSDQTPVFSLSTSTTYKRLLSTMKETAISSNNYNWKEQYVAWWQIKQAMQSIYIIAIIVCALSFISALFMYLHKNDGFIVGADTTIFAITACTIIAGILHYLLNTYGILIDADNKAWQEVSGSSYPRCRMARYLFVHFFLVGKLLIFCCKYNVCIHSEFMIFSAFFIFAYFCIFSGSILLCVIFCLHAFGLFAYFRRWKKEIIYLYRQPIHLPSATAEEEANKLIKHEMSEEEIVDEDKTEEDVKEMKISEIESIDIELKANGDTENLSHEKNKKAIITGKEVDKKEKDETNDDPF